MGTIRKIGKSWWIDYRVNGKRSRKRIGRSKRIAELALKDVEVKIAKGRAGFETKKISIHKFFEEYINYINVTLAHRSATRYKAVIDHFGEFINTLENPPRYIQDITSALLEHYKQSRVGTVSNQTVNFELVALKTALYYAKKMKYLRDNPAVEVSKVRVVNKKLPRFLDKVEIQKLLQACSPDLNDIVIFLINTGLRLGELTNLEWNDVDLNQRIIKISAKEDWVPKAKQERQIPLNEAAFQVLNNKQNRAGYIFTTSTGNTLNHTLRRFKRVCKKAGIENACLHTLRHTFASHLVMSGVDIMTVSKLLGHSSITMTEKYAHLAPDHLRGAVEKLEFS